MEERVGLLWHRTLTRLARSNYPHAAVEFSSIAGRLPIWFHAFGGDPAIPVQAASESTWGHIRKLRERIAGTGEKAALAWLDEQACRLPAVLDVYPKRRLNRDLYLWLVALAASLPKDELPWLAANQFASLHILNKFPGLQPRYQQLVEAEIARRPALAGMSRDRAEQERAIREALRMPGTVRVIPSARKPWYPVLLWLHPNTPNLGSGTPRTMDSSPLPGSAREIDTKRRVAKRQETPKGRSGLFVPRPETILSWAQYSHIDLEARQDENGAALSMADDLDQLTLAQDGTVTAKALRADLDIAVQDTDTAEAQGQILLPEWDYRRGTLRAARCVLREEPLSVANGDSTFPTRLLRERRRLKAQFEALTPQRTRSRLQPDGSELDLDRCLQQRLEKDSDPRLYIDMRRKHRDLATLLLADLSLSTDAAVDSQRRVIDVIRDSLLLFSDTLTGVGDRFALYGFSSRSRKDVRFHPLKSFAEAYGPRVRARINSIGPGYYTRLGAAIRAATRTLSDEPARKRLLLLLTDGKPNDSDAYEGRYGIEDTRHAFLDARRQGLHPFCVTIDQTSHAYLPYVFGQNNFVIIRRASELPTKLTLLYAQLSNS